MRRTATAWAVSLTAPVSGAGLCALTRRRVSDWESHKKTFEFRLSSLLADRLSHSENPLRTHDLFTAFVNPTRLVDEFISSRASRRYSRLTSSLSFLRRHNVLLHSLLFYSVTTRRWHVLPEFSRLALMGEAILRSEVSIRLLKVFPDIPVPLYTEIINTVLSEANLSQMFDRLGLRDMVGADANHPDIHPSGNEKASMLCGAVGEMHWFTVRTRATDRTHNNALFPPSDALILHVLAGHVLESVPAELLYKLLSARLAVLWPAWTNFPMSVPEQLTAKTFPRGVMQLSSVQRSATPEDIARAAAGMEAHVEKRLVLTPEKAYCSVTSYAAAAVSGERFGLPWYKVLPVDKRPVSCTLSSGKQPRLSSDLNASRIDMPAERRRELSLSAIKQ